MQVSGASVQLPVLSQGYGLMNSESFSLDIDRLSYEFSHELIVAAADKLFENMKIFTSKVEYDVIATLCAVLFMR